MAPATDIDTASLIVSAVVILVAALLGWGEWRDRRGREPDPSPEDARHFAGQDARRALGIVVLVLLAAGIAIGSRVPSRVDHRANPLFVGIWLGVFVLVFVLLSLAMCDWLALRRFAARHRGRIVRERIEMIREEAARRRAADGEGNGHGDGPLGGLFH